MTQAQLAAVLGVHAITVSRWESQTSRQRPTPFQAGLLEWFALSATQICTPGHVATLIVTRGAIDGLAYLLRLAFPGVPGVTAAVPRDAGTAVPSSVKRTS